MKYIADHILIAPDETPASLRKKVASRLGVSVAGLHVEVVRRRWKRLKDGGAIEVRVEAETSEFIHNTAYLASLPQKMEIPEVSLRKRPVVVGFGIRGIIAAFMLARMGLKPIVLEAGRSLSSADSHNGENGVGVYSGEGGLACFCGATFTPDALDPNVREALAEEGITFNTIDAYQYLPPAFVRSLVHRLHLAILKKGGEVLFEAQYTETKKRFGKVRGVYFVQNGKRTFLRTHHVIMANGHSDDTAFLGLCIETDQRRFNQAIYGKAQRDAKLPAYFQSTVFKSKKGDRCLIMTGLPNPSMMDVGSSSERLSQAFRFDGKNRNAVSYIAISMPLEKAQATCAAAYVAGKPNVIPYSTMADFLKGKDPLRLGSVKPMDIRRAQIRSMQSVIGAEQSASITAALDQIRNAFPYLFDEGALLSGLVCLQGHDCEASGAIGSSGIYVAGIAPEKSMDFAAEAGAGFRAFAALCTHANKAH